MFDYQSALKSGASEDDVLNYLNQTRDFDIRGAINAGADKQQIIDYLSNSDISEQTQTPQNQTPFFDKLTGGVGNTLGNIFGGNKIGELLGSQIARLSPDFQRLQQFAPDIAKQEASRIPSAKELIGDVGQVGLTLGTLGTTAPESTLARMGLNAALGAGFGTSLGLKQNKSAGDIAKQAAFGGVVGALAPEAIRYVGRKIAQATQSTAEGLVNSAFQTSKRQLQQDLGNELFGKETFAQKFLEEGNQIAGKGARGAYQTINQNILPNLGDNFEEFKDLIGNKRIDISDLVNGLSRASKKLEPLLEESNPELLEKIQNAAESKTLSWSDALELKQAINKYAIPPSSFYNDVHSAATQTLKNTAAKIANKLAEKAGDITLEDGTTFDILNKRWGVWKTASDLLEKRLTKPALSRIEKLIIGSGVAGAPFTGGATLGAIPAVAAEKAITSFPAQLGGGFALNKLNQVGQNILQNPALQQATKTAFFRLLGGQGQ